MSIRQTTAILLGMAICWPRGFTDGQDSTPQDNAQSEQKEKSVGKTDEPGLKIGDKAPNFSGTDDEGKAWKLADHLGKNHVVVYFYPADFTLGCTRQALAFRDHSNALSEAGVTVVGVSGDSVANHQLFKQEWDLNFNLLADEEASIAEKFGVPFRKSPARVRARGSDGKPLETEDGEPLFLTRKATLRRWTYIIDPHGKIVYKNMRVNPARDSEEVLKFIQQQKTQESLPTSPNED